MAAAGLEVRLEPLQGALPAIRWRRDEETEILSGGFKPVAKGRGASITVELADDEGAIVVLDVVAGRLTGLDVVIWPALDPVPGLRPPATFARRGGTLARQALGDRGGRGRAGNPVARFHQ